MKIAYLSTFYPFRGGIAQFNASLYRIFEKNNEIKAYTFTRQYPTILFPGSSQYVTSNDKVDKIPSSAILDTVNPISYSRAARKILEFKPDMLLTKFWMPFFAPSLGTVSKILKKHNVINISILDNVIPHERRMGDIALTKYFLKQQHAFVVMSNSVKDDLLKLLPNAIYELHPHPIYDHFASKIPKNDARKSLNLPENKKILLFFGFIRDYKGLDLLLKSMKLLSEDYHLVIAGEVYGKFDKYDDLISRLHIQNKVSKFIRYIRDNEVPAFFSAADVAVLPYKSATQSGIIAICYQYDLPVIATDTGSLKEMVEPYGTGLIVDKIDYQSLTATIEKFFSSNPEKYSQNIEQYKSKYSWENLSYAILNLYSKIALEMKI